VQYELVPATFKLQQWGYRYNISSFDAIASRALLSCSSKTGSRQTRYSIGSIWPAKRKTMPFFKPPNKVMMAIKGDWRYRCDCNRGKRTWDLRCWLPHPSHTFGQHQPKLISDYYHIWTVFLKWNIPLLYLRTAPTTTKTVIKPHKTRATSVYRCNRNPNELNITVMGTPIRK